MAKRGKLLVWRREGCENCWTSRLGVPGDCVDFFLSHQPTCYRRGPWRLLIEVCGGEHHFDWGCFDDADQPLRYFHDGRYAMQEAESIARVLKADREKISPNMVS